MPDAAASKSSSLRRSVSLATVFVVAGSMITLPALPASAEPGGIVISELNYHAGSDADGDDFLELANTSGAPINLSGWAFTSGVSGALPAGSAVPAGGRFVVAKDAALFQARHGFAPNATYGGNLANSGETITLSDAAVGGAVIDTVTYADVAPWPVSPDGTGPTLELRDLLADNTDAANWGASTADYGTPGKRNSLEGDDAAPVIGDLAATPARPAANEPVVVSAKLKPGSTATLTYRVMFRSDVQVPFLDDAASPGGAGDGVYAATIPGQAAGQLIRYRVDAKSGATDYSAPAADDTVRYRGVVVRDSAITSQLPVIEWFMDDAVYDDILANHRFDDVAGEAVWAYNGEVIDGALMSVRGNSSRDSTKVNWKVQLPKGYMFDLGGKLDYPLDEFALQAYIDNFADVSWATVEGAGARSLNITPVRTQRNGAFWSLGRIMETMDGEWRDDQGVDDWSIYKADIGGAVGRTDSPEELESLGWLDKKSREEEDFTDVWTLSNTVDAPASAAQKAWIYENVNVPELINYMAVNSIIRHADSGWYNWWLARDTEGTGRWEMWHWDFNWTFRTNASDGKGPFLTPDTSNNFTQAMLAYPEFREMYFRRLRTLADKFLPAGKYEAEWDAITAQTGPDWQLDRARWGGYTPSGARTTFVNGLADRRTVINSNTGDGKPVPTSQSANASVVINELQYNPAGNGGEFIELVNPGPTAVDISGWTIDAVNLTIQAGTVVPAGGHVVFVSDDTGFRQAYTGVNRFVGGQFPGGLGNGGELIELRDGTRVVDSVNYTDKAPWPTAADGTGPSLELSSPAADNAVAANWTATSTTGGTPGLKNTAGATPPPPGGSALAQDAFTRTVSGGLGSADTGGAWTVSSSASNYSVSGGVARLSTPRGSTRIATLTDVSSTDTEVRATIGLPRPTASSVYAGVSARSIGSGGYGARVIVASNGSVQLQVHREGYATVQKLTVPGLTFNNGDRLSIRLQVTGTSPTTLRAKVWKTGTAEPASWQITTTDASGTLQRAGSVGLYSYLSSTASPNPGVVTFDDLWAGPTGSAPADPEPPANVAPVASFTATADGMKVNVDASAAKDSDGTLTSYAWNFGEGPAGTGITASRTYTTPGEKLITLTVTDDDGATHTVTRTVTVAEPDEEEPPAGDTALAEDAFTRTVSGGLGSADTGGAWTVSSSASNYSVADGVARLNTPAGSTRTATLNGVSSSDTEVRATIGLPRPTASSVYAGISARRVGTADYGARVIVASNGSVQLQVHREGYATVQKLTVPGLTFNTGDKLSIRLQVTGTSPTTLRAKVWKAGAAEPGAWQVDTTDGSSALQRPGAVGLYSYLSSTRSPAPATVTFDDLWAGPTG
jgi:hypothetical protein